MEVNQGQSGTERKPLDVGKFVLIFAALVVLAMAGIAYVIFIGESTFKATTVAVLDKYSRQYTQTVDRLGRPTTSLEDSHKVTRTLNYLNASLDGQGAVQVTVSKDLWDTLEIGKNYTLSCGMVAGDWLCRK